MPDLKQRLDAVDLIPVDDVWPEIRERFEDEASGRVPPVRIDERRRRPEVGWRKALTIAAVFVLLAAAAVALVKSLTSHGVPADRPVEPTPVAAGVPGALAYARDGYIYLADPDGTNAVPIDVPPYHGCGGTSGATDLHWSPDGRYLAFRQGCKSTGLSSAIWKVVIADAEGSVVAKIPMAPTTFAWSPDSTRIAVIQDAGYTIGLYGVDGVRHASVPAPLAVGSPTWMPGGSELLVRGSPGGTPLVVPLDGGPVGPFPGGMPYPSPDGTRVAVIGPGSTVITDADGTPVSEVDLDLFGGPGVAWSPDGDRFAAVTGSAVEGTDLVVVDASSGEVTTLTAEAMAPLLRYRHLRRRIERVLGFSPDGDRILYVGWGTGYTPLALYSIGVDGSDAHLIVRGVMDAAWRPV